MVTTLSRANPAAPHTVASQPERQQRFATTPGRLRLVSLVLVGLFVLFGVLGTAALRARHSAARSVGLQSSPQLLDAQSLYLALADADATSSNAFLRAGLESFGQRQQYLDDLTTASTKLASISERADVSPTAQHAVNVIGSDLPKYAGLVEQARSNNRQGFPVGAAYLNDASSLMRSDMLPRATELYEDAAQRLQDDYGRGSSWPAAAGIGLTFAVLLVALVIAQIYVFTKSNRIINVGLFAAMVLVAVVGVWALRVLQNETSALGRAQTHGSDIVQVLSTGRILLLHAQGDEDLALIARGGGPAFLVDLDYTLGKLGGPDGQKGLLGFAAKVVPPDDPAVRTAPPSRAYQHFVSAHDRVRNLDNIGHYPDAVALAVGGETDDASALDAILRDEIAYSNQTLARESSAARGGFAVPLVAFPIAALVGAVLMLLGLQLRIREYR
ncbi:MAG TPA: hypothetical protein VMK16_14335 [Acidimicrobiales bacterium]|nr:hypothetical protein [Acidimicrobiales bacterium]